MNNKNVYLNDKMYAIFHNAQIGNYVQPCTIIKIDRYGFYAECHNGGKNGHGKGTEYFRFEDIGKGIFYSKDSAEIHCKGE